MQYFSLTSVVGLFILIIELIAVVLVLQGMTVGPCWLCRIVRGPLVTGTPWVVVGVLVLVPTFVVVLVGSPTAGSLRETVRIAFVRCLLGGGGA